VTNPRAFREEWKVLKERFFAGEPVDPVFEVLSSTVRRGDHRVVTLVGGSNLFF
jgi:hypothetical protein